MTKRLLRVATMTPVHLFLVVVAVLWLLPTTGLLVQSLRTPADISQTGWWTALLDWRTLGFDNYGRLLESRAMARSFWNTVIITLPTTFLVVGLASTAAYALTWMRFPGRDAIFLLVIALLVVPLQVALIPLAQLFGAVGLFGSIASVVLFHTAFGLPFAVFLLRNFFIGVPADLFESARVDGAGHGVLFTRIALPLAFPGIASLAIFQFLWVWNDLLISLVFARPSNAPLTAAILQQTRNFGQNVDIIAPGAFLQMLVPLIVFFAFQRYFVAGIMGGAVKE